MHAAAFGEAGLLPLVHSETVMAAGPDECARLVSVALPKAHITDTGFVFIREAYRVPTVTVLGTFSEKEGQTLVAVTACLRKSELKIYLGFVSGILLIGFAVWAFLHQDPVVCAVVAGAFASTYLILLGWAWLVGDRLTRKVADHLRKNPAWVPTSTSP